MFKTALRCRYRETPGVAFPNNLKIFGEALVFEGFPYSPGARLSVADSSIAIGNQIGHLAFTFISIMQIFCSHVGHDIQMTRKTTLGGV